MEIVISRKTAELLDIVKKHNPEASYEDVILFLVSQYCNQLEEQVMIMQKEYDEDERE